MARELMDPEDIGLEPIIKEKVAEARTWFQLLKKSCHDYMYGEGDKFVPVEDKDHEDAERWIFGPQNYQYCFDEVWLMFFEDYEQLEPRHVKVAMKKKAIKKYKRHIIERIKENAEAQDSNGGRETADSDPDRDKRVRVRAHAGVRVKVCGV